MTGDEKQERIDEMMHGIRTDLEKAKTIDIKKEHGDLTAKVPNGVTVITITMAKDA